MRRRVTIGIVALIALAAAALFLTLLQKQRANRDLVYTVNNLRELGQFLELNPDRAATPGAFEAIGKSRFTPVPPERFAELGLAPQIPAGTRGTPALFTQRLSWISTLLPAFNQARQPTADLARQLDPSQPWDAPPNGEVAANRLGVLEVYARPLTTPAGLPVPTALVGLGGIGPDAATGPRGPASGAFLYGEPTPFPLITDGLAETGVLCDTSTGLGPWLQGGPATVRSFDPARPAIGPGAQFGGNFPAGALVGYADHSVRLLSTRTDPAIIANLMTIAGAGKIDPTPGE